VPDGEDGLILATWSINHEGARKLYLCRMPVNKNPKSQAQSSLMSTEGGDARPLQTSARQIKFRPAQKDGHAVSQYVVLEYSFNIY
jgi:hypothetical protein